MKQYAAQIERVTFDCSLFLCSGNTRTIKQSALQDFQVEMAKVKNDPYKVVIRQTKQPISLLNAVSKVGPCLKVPPQHSTLQVCVLCNEQCSSVGPASWLTVVKTLRLEPYSPATPIKVGSFKILHGDKLRRLFVFRPVFVTLVQFQGYRGIRKV